VPLLTLKRIKAGLAILALPLCFGAAESILRLVQTTGNAETIWVATGAGVACWLVIYLSLPKPMWVYVFGHELTHALWAWLCGAKVKRFKATAKGGHVVVTRSNFLIALAPYFFPIYAIAVVLLFLMGQALWGWKRYSPWFHLCLGAAYAFHLTLTWHVLKTRQSDIADQGYLFSAVVIWLGNAAVLILGIPLLIGGVGVLTALGWCCAHTAELLRTLEHLLSGTFALEKPL
jgi:Peptidase M50B-like